MNTRQQYKAAYRLYRALCRQRDSIDNKQAKAIVTAQYGTIGQAAITSYDKRFYMIEKWERWCLDGEISRVGVGLVG